MEPNSGMQALNRACRLMDMGKQKTDATPAELKKALKANKENVDKLRREVQLTFNFK